MADQSAVMKQSSTVLELLRRAENDLANGKRTATGFTHVYKGKHVPSNHQQRTINLCRVWLKRHGLLHLAG